MARAELFDAVADLIERSETETLDARHEMKAFAEVFNALPALLASTLMQSATGAALIALAASKLDGFIAIPRLRAIQLVLRSIDDIGMDCL
ncbi:hypothetical protein BKA70DRAFT_1438322 [Coprinopsis sp. MPI-PUGE-AT-0042]|nr:hypothetical protein BKA70DRAFT_1438322 [Coprinopsis sp. MPI-PUGE-AT-0042]